MIFLVLKLIFSLLLIVILKWQFITPYLTYRKYKRLGFECGSFIPIIGFGWHMWKGMKYRGDVNAYFKTCGLKTPKSKGVILNMGSHVYIYLQDTELIKEFLVAKYQFYQKEYFIIEFLSSISGKINIINSEGEQWKKSRKLLSKCFHYDVLKGNIPTVVSICDENFSLFDQGNSKIEALNVFQEIAGKVFIRSFCGKELSDMKFEGKSLPLFLADMVAALSEELFTLPYILFGARANKMGLIKGHSALIKKVNELRRVLTIHIEEKRKLWVANKSNGLLRTKPDLLFELFEAGESLGGEISNERILDEILVLFIAGTDTTGHLLAHTTWALTQNPEVLAKLKSEIDSEVKVKSDINATKLQALPYLNAVLKESLRLYPGANEIFPRECIETHKLGDITIQKGTLVALSLLNNFYNTSHFKNPLEFRPERWLDETENVENRNIFAYLPFSGGGRNCIGQNLAMLEGKIALIYFLKKFDFKLIDGYQMKWNVKFLTEPQDKLEFIISERPEFREWNSK